MTRISAVLGIAFVTLGIAVPVLAMPHSDSSHAAHEARLAFDQGRKWATDEPLRRHMGEIRAALSQRSGDILAGRLTDRQAQDLGTLIEARVALIVTDCKLPPEADANLHLIVADLVEAAEILQGRTKQKPQRGTAIAARAAQMYATYFDHPGWKPVY